MARTKSFDEPLILNKMMDVFWQQGFDTTSMRHLEKATNLSAGSIYNEFGSKQKLFDRTLSFYINTVIEGRVNSYLKNYTPILEGVRQFVLSTFKDVPKQYQRQSCLLVNTAAELGQNDKLIGATIKRGLRRIDKAMFSALERAKQNKELAEDVDCKVLTAQISLMLPGLLIASKNNVSSTELAFIVDSTLEQLM